MRLRVLVLLFAVLALLAAGCNSDSDDAAAEETTTTTEVAEAAEPGPTVEEPAETDGTAAVPQDETTLETTTSPPEDPGGPIYPWHAAGSAHASPVEAVQEFVEFMNFDEATTLSEFRQGDSRSGEIDIDVYPPGSDSPTADLPVTGGDFLTTAFVRLDDDDNWVVIGAASSAIDVDEPVSGATVSSPFHVHFDHNAGSNGVVMQLWPEGATVPIVDEMVTTTTGVFVVGVMDETVRWESAATGPAFVVIRSGDPEAWAVTTLQLNLDG